MLHRRVHKNFLTMFDTTTAMLLKLLCLFRHPKNPETVQLRSVKGSLQTILKSLSVPLLLTQTRTSHLPLKKIAHHHSKTSKNQQVKKARLHLRRIPRKRLVMVMCSVECLQLDSMASTRRPRVTKYSKTTLAPGVSTEPATERSLMTATYRLQDQGGDTCILLTVDALLDISYMTKLNERADANTFVPNNANVAGACRESDAETLVISFKEFALEWSFAKTPGGERWYVEYIRLTYNSSARILEHAAKQGRKVTLSTDVRSLLFPTPVGKSFYCPEETVVDLMEGDVSATTAQRAKLYLRQMRLQAFMYKHDGEFGPPWHCSDSARARSETAPVAVGAALAIATAGTLIGYAVWRYLKVKKVQYDTME